MYDGQQRVQHHRRHSVPRPVSRFAGRHRCQSQPGRLSLFPRLAHRARFVFALLHRLLGRLSSRLPAHPRRDWDYSHRRKRMMQLFAVVGALATTALFLVQRTVVAGWCLVHHRQSVLRRGHRLLQCLSARHRQRRSCRDRVSSFGWAMGYLGGGLLLIVNLARFSCSAIGQHQQRLRPFASISHRLLWWLGWSVWTWLTLRSRHRGRSLPAGENLPSIAFKQLSGTMETPPGQIAALLSPLAVLVLLPIVTLLRLPVEWVFLALLGANRDDRHLPVAQVAHAAGDGQVPCSLI